jgi:hypothetical protein
MPGPEPTAAVNYLLSWPPDPAFAAAYCVSASALTDAKSSVHSNDMTERCDLLAQDCEGDTALHLMARNGCRKLLGLILQCAEQRGVLKQLLLCRNRQFARAIDLATAPFIASALTVAHSRIDLNFDRRAFDGMSSPLCTWAVTCLVALF